MSRPATFDAVLLAGGRSRRLGRDKAFLDWGGVPLYVAQLRKLASLSPARLWLSTRGEQNFPEVLGGVHRIRDERPDLGPLGGLLSALSASEADRLLVLAVDLPQMEPGYLAALLGRETGSVPRGDRGWEPLAAVYPRAAMLALVREAVAAERLRLQDLLDLAAARGLVEAVPIAATEARLFANLNTPADLEALERGSRDEAVLLDRYRVDCGFVRTPDRLAIEEPCEIRINGTGVAVTMRTPGDDEDLVRGFLFTEGLLTSPDEIIDIVRCGGSGSREDGLPPDERSPHQEGQVFDVRLRGAPDLTRLSRHLFTSSSCGICGKASLEAVFGSFPPLPHRLDPSPATLLALPAKLRSVQATFERTGGLHASALFDPEGRLLVLREDVGRHNALDKVIGHALARDLPLGDSILLVSGRISFELMQKALAARIPVVAGISAPSSLAVKLARESGQVLVGFLREGGFNVYAGSAGA